MYNHKENVTKLSELTENFYHNNSLRDRINQKAYNFKKILSNKLNRLTNKYISLNDKCPQMKKENLKIICGHSFYKHL